MTAAHLVGPWTVAQVRSGADGHRVLSGWRAVNVCLMKSSFKVGNALLVVLCHLKG